MSKLFNHLQTAADPRRNEKAAWCVAYAAGQEPERQRPLCLSTIVSTSRLVSGVTAFPDLRRSLLFYHVLHAVLQPELIKHGHNCYKP